MEETSLSRNSLMLIAMANEYCHVLENAQENEYIEFVDKMLKLLPRIYMSVTDVEEKEDEESMVYIDSYLQETEYNSVRKALYQVLGDKDDYLEVFEEDMKYSDAPILTTISENLSDLYQEMYNLVMSVKNSPAEVANDIILSFKTNFSEYWGQTLVNVLRALHNVKYNNEIID